MGSGAGASRGMGGGGGWGVVGVRVLARGCGDGAFHDKALSDGRKPNVLRHYSYKDGTAISMLASQSFNRKLSSLQLEFSKLPWPILQSSCTCMCSIVDNKRKNMLIHSDGINKKRHVL